MCVRADELSNTFCLYAFGHVFIATGIPTFWDAPDDFLHGANPTYGELNKAKLTLSLVMCFQQKLMNEACALFPFRFHDCITTTVDHGNQTAGYYPCLNPNVFQPTDLDADDWMQASSAMGMKEICITAKHEGGFALWPSNYTPYSVAASSWRNGSGDVLREFVDAARRWGINICYYCNVMADGYLTKVANVSGAVFAEKQVGFPADIKAHC